MTPSRAMARAALVAAGVLAADQLTKALVRGALARGDEEALLPGVTLVNVRNSGVAFGLFEDAGGVLVLFTLAALAGLLIFFARNAARPFAWLAVGLLAGGAVGNLVDRIAAGEVTDFIDLPAWPAFNLADVAITIGVIGLLVVLERSDAGRQRPA